MKIECSSQIFEKYSISDFMKMRPMGAELFHADRQMDGRTDRQTDRQTDMTKLIVTFRNFVNAPKKVSFRPVQYLHRKLFRCLQFFL